MILVAALVWGVRGELPTNVLGSCILMRSGGIQEITFNNQGRVSDLAVREGDDIEQGQLIARLQQRDLRTRYRNMLEDRVDLDEKIASQELVVDQRTAAIKMQINDLENRIISREKLFAEGLVTRQLVQEDKSRLANLRTELEQLPLQIEELQNQLDQANRTLEAERRRLEEASRVYSDHSGRVIEVMAADGQLVGVGTPLLNLEPSGLSVKNVETVCYVPAGPAKNIKLGAEVRISPATVKREEYGTLIGRVTYVAPYPATYNGMMAVLHNDQLVRQLSSVGSPIQIKADLIPDTNEENESGYRWTSPKGPDTTIEPGTLASAQVTTRKQAPITLVVPAIRKFLGVY
ncbi:hypothetical protein A3709_12040 [Halioglobus sp. HI00S01]|uniref:NHLP bacteriocin system secretion protein n=1 Tax=Halioglobus sp. HI00S01 TaxID=1822214 RepID=UPI0007C3B263|nr:NHLP bacteriocin system secretion protein [Halioglobus sp. HI00S01]KZX60314.1 hypothetical protein A3709_12040 [Halioglobus sp. HI00S01]